MPAPRLKKILVRTKAARSMAVLLSVVFLTGCDERLPVSVPHKTIVQVEEARAGRTSDIVTLTGAIQARVQSDLSFRFAGRLATRYVEVGEHVEAGQLLAKLETSQQEADVASSRAALAAAEAAVRQTTGTYKRQKSLIDSGFTTRTQFDNANQAMLAAEADVKSQQSALDVSLDALKNADLRAGAAGIITARHAEAGQVVDVAQPIFTLAQDGPRDAVFEVYESLVTRPAADFPVRIALLSNPDVAVTGRVREVAPAVNTATGAVRVKVEIAETPREMGLGSAVAGSGDFRLRDIVKLSNRAFHTKAGQMAVWVVDGKTKAASERLIDVDSFRTGELLLRSGVQPGELVVTSGGQFLRPGDIVTPTYDQAQANPKVSK